MLIDTIHVCGDSVFDNGRYVQPAPDFAEHLTYIEKDRMINMMAVDGAIINDVYRFQLSRIPRDDVRFHDAIILSAGGNDVLQHLPKLQSMRPRALLGTANMLADMQMEFRMEYRRLLKDALAITEHVLTCTIYRPCYAYDQRLKKVSKAIDPLLSMFNDVIVEESSVRKLEIVDLRHVCRGKRDFANAIEPSSEGARKIAVEVSKWLDQIDPSKKSSGGSE